MNVVVATELGRAAIEAAVRLGATLEADHAASRHAIDRAAHALATLKPKEPR